MAKTAEDPYSFHLDSTGESVSSSGSSTTASSTLCKEKIDRIFAEKRRTLLGLPDGIPSAFSNREEQDKFKKHLQLQIQRIVNERRCHLEKELGKDPPPPPPPPQPQKIRTARTSPTASTIGYDAQIDKLFSDACDAHDTSTVSGSGSGSVSLSVSVTPSSSDDMSSFVTEPHHRQQQQGGRRLPAVPADPSVRRQAPDFDLADGDGDGDDSAVDPVSGLGVFYQHSRTKVEYLGCLPLQEKATHLEVLQLPLKQLYLQHLALTSRGQSPLRGTVEITGTGLKLQYFREERAGVQEIFNPFPTIAVWAAVKFVIRKTKFAFLPLICDPESQEKHKLFHDLTDVPGKLDLSGVTHPPLFACVMRKVGLSRVLECHGFVCSSSEDAIVLAANLYQALLDNMREENSIGNIYDEASLTSNHRQDVAEVPHSRPRSASVNHVHQEEMTRLRGENGKQPVPPPRKKRGQIYEANYSDVPGRLDIGKRSVSEEALSRTETEALQRELKERMSSRGSRESRIKRSASDRHAGGISLTDSESAGDIYTKVALPRSKSFMNITGRYDLKDLFLEMKTRRLHSVDDLLKEIISPKGMSFSEMKPVYRDLLLKLALTLSKDEIYQRSKNIMRKHNKKRSHMGGLMGIHNPHESDTDGSAISSVFKATKRSLSKFTSMRQKPSESRYNVSGKARASTKMNSKAKSSENLAASMNSLPGTEGLLSAKHASGKRSPGDLDRSTSASMKSGLHQRSHPRKKAHAPPPPVKAKTPLPNRKLPPLPTEVGSSSECGYDSESCDSETKCYCSLKHSQKHSAKHSDKTPAVLPCDCDQESCIESEKCYCSLRMKNKDGTKFFRINLDSGTETDTTINSTASRQTPKRKLIGGSTGNLSGLDSPLTAWRKNFGLSSSGVDSPDRPSSHEQASRRSSLDPIYVGTASMFGGGGMDAQPSDSHDSSGKSRRRPSMAKPRSRSTDNLSPVERASSSSPGTDQQQPQQHVHKRKKMLVVSAVDPNGKVVYHASADAGPAHGNAAGGPNNNNHHHQHRPQHRPSFAHKTRSAASAFLGSMLGNAGGGCRVDNDDDDGDVVGSPVVSGTLSSDTLLSFKKTAEIAALFSEVKLNQTTDIVDNDSLYSESSEDDAYSSMQNLTSGQNSMFMFSDTNIENSLGYLP